VVDQLPKKNQIRFTNKERWISKVGGGLMSKKKQPDDLATRKQKEDEAAICKGFGLHVEEDHFKHIKEAAEKGDLALLDASIVNLLSCFYSGILATTMIPVESTLEQEVDKIMKDVKLEVLEGTRSMIHYLEGNQETLN
jgi:hypothetical protein